MLLAVFHAHALSNGRVRVGDPGAAQMLVPAPAALPRKLIDLGRGWHVALKRDHLKVEDLVVSDLVPCADLTVGGAGEDTREVVRLGPHLNQVKALLVSQILTNI